MDYTKATPAKPQPRLIIHGGAGNIRRETMPKERYEEYRSELLRIVSSTRDYMLNAGSHGCPEKAASSQRPSALEVATYAVVQLENNPLFNSGHGAVFTRDGINQLEASVMVSRGYKKRGLGVSGLRHVRNPILLARKLLEHGEEDLSTNQMASTRTTTATTGDHDQRLNVPSAQGHSIVFGEAAEQLAEQYGLEMVDPSYFFTQQRWDEHVRALERETANTGLGTWSADEYLPQGTCGAVASDEDGVVCVATSTGGMTNKLTGRIGDTPVAGSGFWAEEWTERGDPTGSGFWDRLKRGASAPGPLISFSGPLQGLIADCLPSLRLHNPVSLGEDLSSRRTTTTTRSMAGSGTGNGDSFIRVNALRTAAAMARWKPQPAQDAVTAVVGRGGELQQSAGDRWGRTGEGEGGIIGIESAVVRDAGGRVVEARSEVLMDYNCGGMYRAWIDDDGEAVMSIWSNGSPDEI